MDFKQSARGRTHISDLGPELLNAVFHKLGPSPMHLAAVSCVSRMWGRIMQEDVWRQLCPKRERWLYAAPWVISVEGFLLLRAGWLCIN